MTIIDLNADLGEGFGDYTIADDRALMPLISSANVACGFHAGDAAIMADSVRLAKAHQVDLGAHVGFPDLLGFGRRRMQIDTDTLAHYVTYQLGALAGFARAAHYPMTHMSFHGALGNMAAEDPQLAEPLLQAVKAFDAGLIISTTAGNAVERSARRLGFKVATTFLADRAYDRHGMLVRRGLPGAVIHEVAQVSQRVIRLLTQGTVESIEGDILPMSVTSILLHGDTAGALALARQLRRDIEALGIKIVPISRH
ncbi:LamB/YcsF family protein [Brenneria tiliae]|uniref:LamB/YcsF family protein n=1 Tax=Brenneria tiliae TaxID=2914984 RepID=UPI0020148873|nr:5-oxoprolinase subunit PxpA [Brenneria tiliae]MCL2896930.1 LamB/YcsF family protein [Brenneria tiliae]MCL2901488.1 LamB/YcsF family protein [Brenneria tiliae]